MTFVTSRDDPDRLFDRSVTLDLLHIVKLEPLETAGSPARRPARNASRG